MKQKLYKKTVLNIQKRVSESVKKQVPALDYIMDTANMSPTDKIFYEAYKKYGTRNHTWQDFRDMFNGDVNLMCRTVRGWKTWDEINTMSFNFYEERKVLLGLMKKYNIQFIDDDNKDSFKTQYPDLVQQYDKASYLLDLSYSNYSTFNPKVSKLIKEFQQKLDTIPESQQKKIMKLFSEYIYKFDKYIDLRNADFVVGERIQTYTDIIKNNPIILGLVSNFDFLDSDTKLKLSDRILRKSAEVQGTANCDIVETKTPDTPNKKSYTVALYNDIDDVFIFNTTCPEFSILDCYLTVLVHEDGHRIDYCNADYGIIGEQFMNFFSENYLNDDMVSESLYLKQATEQSSYYIDKPIKIALLKTIQENKMSLTKTLFCVLRNKLYSKIHQRNLTK